MNADEQLHYERLKRLKMHIVMRVAHEFDDGDDKVAEELFDMLLEDWKRLKSPKT